MKTCMTFEEYLGYEDGTDIRYELVNGELAEMPPESQENNDITKALLFALAHHVSLELIAFNTEIEVSGSRATCRLPDLMVHTELSKTALSGARRATITRDMPPPALVIEVVSPGEVNRKRDYCHKRSEYAARDINEYWIVDPHQAQVVVLTLVEGLYEETLFKGTQPLASQVIPTFRMTAAQVLKP